MRFLVWLLLLPLLPAIWALSWLVRWRIRRHMDRLQAEEQRKLTDHYHRSGRF